MADNTLRNIKQHDTWPTLDAVLKDGNGDPIDLTAATQVKVLAKNSTGSVTWSGTCTITSAPAGAVTYTFTGVTDTSTVNSYDAEFEITWTSGKITTVPTVGYFKIVVGADLG